MLRQIPPSNDEKNSLWSRFCTAQSEPPEDIEARKHVQAEVQALVVDLGTYIGYNVENCREKDQALTHLEEVLMWAGKAIFS